MCVIKRVSRRTQNLGILFYKTQDIDVHATFVHSNTDATFHVIVRYTRVLDSFNRNRF
jgi:hypothetical protein